ncbi:hypothetical protein ACHAXA_005069 [Cyclostephanos tholiformis]|uniref:Fe2OG dioxygenase domain-containing protein n=1 Tax=Cyclostephanos tholiformis TaxID=382380 RepID=A0ABD3SSY3_9STRA
MAARLPASALLLLVAIVAATNGMDAEGGGGGGFGDSGGGECDAMMNPDDTCGDASSLDGGAPEDADGSSPPGETTGILLRSECVDKEPRCPGWAAEGECDKNPDYMLLDCAVSCNSCPEPVVISTEDALMLEAVARYGKAQRVERRRRIPSRPALLPGELNAMFERIVNTAPGNMTDPNYVIEDGMTNYTVTVHSRPRAFGPNEERVISAERDLNEPPWVITFDNFITEEECKHLIDLGYKSEYERSEDVGELLPDGSFESVQNESRTSTNAWCSEKNKCRNDEVAKMIHNRIAKVTGIPPENSEDFQILKYEPGQFYRQHHDYIAFQRDRRCGPRILTFFLYLSDVEEGGATNFPDLNIAVKPKVGRALLWPSVLDSNPKDKEPRTDHEAQDVIKGVKFGANSWMHLHDYIAAQEMGCT